MRNSLSLPLRSIAIPATPTKPFPGEPAGPSITGSVPGPRSQELFKQLDQYQDVRTQHFFVDYTRSRGNYLVDADQNVFLDVLCSIGSHAIGYNNPRMIEAARSEEWITALINRPALGIVPPAQWPKMLEDTLLRIAPPGLRQVFTAMCGTCANETAYKAVFMAHQHRERGGAAFTQAEIDSCMHNAPPGSPELAIMSFKGGFHGRLLGALTTTCSKPVHKLDIPAFNWPVAPFPNLHYPLDSSENEAHNRAEEARCLEAAESIIRNHSVKVVGMVIEPIQGEGGDRAASNDFYRQLRAIARRNNVAFVVDEVQSGVCATGKFWAHEYWGLDDPPDAVSFAKKMQATGFFHNIDLRPSAGYRNFNTWMGDPVRILQAREIIREIDEQKLLDNVNITGTFLKQLLADLSSKYPTLLHNVRGKGTFLAFDLPSAELQGKFLALLRQNGVEAAGCGEATIRFRPMLVFRPQHALQLVERLEHVASKLAH